MARKACPSELTQRQWLSIRPLTGTVTSTLGVLPLPTVEIHQDKHVATLTCNGCGAAATTTGSGSPWFSIERKGAQAQTLAAFCTLTCLRTYCAGPTPSPR